MSALVLPTHLPWVSHSPVSTYTTYGILQCTNYYPKIGPQVPKIQNPSMPLYLSELIVFIPYFIHKIGQIVYYTQAKQFNIPNFTTPSIVNHQDLKYHLLFEYTV